MIRKLSSWTLLAALTIASGAAARGQEQPIRADWFDQPVSRVAYVNDEPRVAFVDDAPPARPGIAQNSLANQAFEEPPHAEAPMLPGQLVQPGAGRPGYDFLQEEGYPFNSGDLNLPGEKLGWFSSVEAAVVLPQLHSELDADQGFRTPTASMAWNIMPRVEVGYRWGDGLGDVRIGFRHLEGHGAEFQPNGNAVNTDLFLNVLDVDYNWTELHMARWPRLPLLWVIPAGLAQRWDMAAGSYGPPMQLRWTYGWRTAQAYFDTRETGTAIDRSVNNFRGAGLNWAMRGTKAMPWHNFAWCAKWGASGMLGNVDQDFYQTIGGVQSISHARTLIGVPTMDGEFGVAYVPDWRRASCRLSAGYMVEQWWCIGETQESNAELFMNGFFFRGELNY